MSDPATARIGRLTRHACRRAAQRNVPFTVIHLIRRFGNVAFDGNGLRVLATDELPCPEGVSTLEWSQTRGVRVVEAPASVVVTVYRTPPR